MKLAILGGSFNPLHIGHAMMADTAVRELGYDKVLFIPTGIPPHKEIKATVTSLQRMEMVRAFCNSVKDSPFELETCEINRKGVSYTIDTVNFLLEKYKNQLSQKPALLMGAEIAAEFYKWKESEKLGQLCHLVIFPRQPDFYSKDSSTFKNSALGRFKGDFEVAFDKENFNYPCTLLDSPLVTVSSTEIRLRIASGKSYRYLLPQAVYEYIESHNLYKI